MDSKTKTKSMSIQRQLDDIRKQMFSLPNLVWENEYHVDEEATSKICPEYVRLVEEHKRLATELNVLTEIIE